MWTGFNWLRIGFNDSCEQGNKRSGSIKYDEFLDQLNDYQLLMKDSAHYT
jgi:hypothetical protein